MRLDEVYNHIKKFNLTESHKDDNNHLMKINESSLSRIESKLRKYPCAIISAYRNNKGVCGDGERITNSQNSKNHRRLLATLREYGYGVTQGNSRYKEQGEFVSEQSIFVSDENGIGGLKDVVRKLSIEYEQETFIYSDLDESTIIIKGVNNCENSFLRKGEERISSLDSAVFGKSSSVYTTIGGREFFYTFGKFSRLPISEKKIGGNGSHSRASNDELFEQELFEYYDVLKEEHQLNERLALKGDYKGTIYQRLVSAVYQTMPLYTKTHRFAWEDLIGKFKRQKEFLSGEFELVPTQEDPYPSSKAMSKNFKKQKEAGAERIKVRTYAEEPSGAEDDDSAHQGHPVFSNEENIDVRFVHDIIAHYYGGHPFSARGEYGAYNRHTKTLGANTPASEALFTEVVAQTSCFYVYGDFVEQKVTLMTDYFDHINVGAFSKGSPFNKYFEIKDKLLVKREDFDGEKFMREFPKISRELIRQERLGKSRVPLEPIF